MDAGVPASRMDIPLVSWENAWAIAVPLCVPGVRKRKERLSKKNRLIVESGKITSLEPGDRIPEFDLPLNDAARISLAALALGKPVVVFFCEGLRGETLRQLFIELHKVHVCLLEMTHVIFVADQPVSATTAFSE